jgi:outer membrane protein TolC
MILPARIKSLGLMIGLLTIGLRSPSRACADTPAESPAPLPRLQAEATHQVLRLGLAECIQLALERQPAIAAARNGLASAESNQRAIESLRVPAWLVHQLPVRRHQASLSVQLQQAAVAQAERDAAHAVQRMYLAAMFAQAQLGAVDTTKTRLELIHKTAQNFLRQGVREIKEMDAKRIDVYLQLTRARREEAVRGIHLALCALQEAVGLGPDCCLEIPEVELPEIQVQLCCSEVIDLALSRRGEIVQARIGAEIFDLEVHAQAISHGVKKQTFAAFADIHSQPLPAGAQQPEYVPAGLGPQMPAYLAGHKEDRVERAQTLAARAHAVVEKTRNLAILEAQDAHMRCASAAQKMDSNRQARDAAISLATQFQQMDKADFTIKLPDVLTIMILEAEARARYNQNVFNELTALADLERVTDGGFCAALPLRIMQAAPAKRLPQETEQDLEAPSADQAKINVNRR